MPLKAFTKSVASGATLSSAFDLGAVPYNNFVLGVPTMTSSCDLFVQVSYDGTTFKRQKYTVASGVVAPGDITIGSAATNCYMNIPDVNARYVKIEISTAMTATTATFKIIIS